MFILSQLERTARGKAGGKEQFREWFRSHKYFSCVLHWCSGGGGLKVQTLFFCGRKWLLFKGIFEPWVPRCPPSFSWSDIFVADGTNSLARFVAVGSLQKQICQMAGMLLGRGRGAWLMGERSCPKCRDSIWAFMELFCCSCWSPASAGSEGAQQQHWVGPSLTITLGQCLRAPAETSVKSRVLCSHVCNLSSVLTNSQHSKLSPSWCRSHRHHSDGSFCHV